MPNIIDQRHTKITLGLVILMVPVLMAVGTAWYMVNDHEQTIKLQWQKISALETAVAVLKVQVVGLK